MQTNIGNTMEIEIKENCHYITKQINLSWLNDRWGISRLSDQMIRASVDATTTEICMHYANKAGLTVTPPPSRIPLPYKVVRSDCGRYYYTQIDLSIEMIVSEMALTGTGWYFRLGGRAVTRKATLVEIARHYISLANSEIISANAAFIDSSSGEPIKGPDGIYLH